MRLIKRHSTVNYQPSARNHVIFLPEVDISVEAIYPDPAKKPLCLQNAEHQSFTQPIEGVQAATRIYPLAGNTRLPHRAPTEATESTIAQRPRKRSRVLNDRELLVALHQKQDKHHFWLKRQMQSLLVDFNRIRNVATKNAFVAHETCRRSWKSLTLLSAEADLQDDGFNERFQFDSTPPRTAVLRRTPSLEDSEYSSSAAMVNARVINDEDDATSPPPTTTARIDTAPSSSAPPPNDNNPAASPTHQEDE